MRTEGVCIETLGAGVRQFSPANTHLPLTRITQLTRIMSYDPSCCRPALKLHTVRRRRLQPLRDKGKEEFFIDQIIDVKIVKGKRWYRVRWLGYGEEDDTWESRHTLRDCKALARWDYAQEQVSVSSASERPTVLNLEGSPLPNIETASR
jgi:hypothetical protein